MSVSSPCQRLSFVPGLVLVALLLFLDSPSKADEKAGLVTGLVFTTDGKSLLWANQAGYLRESDPATGKQRREVLAHKGGVFGFTLSADGKQLVTAGADNLVRLWKTAGLEEVRVFRGHTDKVVGVALSPDGKWVASASYDKTVRIWDGTTGKLRHEMKAHEFRATSVAFAPDGKTLVSGGIAPISLPGISGPTVGDRLGVWDVQRGTLEQRLSLTGDRLLYSPDGRTLLAAGLYMERAAQARGLVIGGIPVEAGSRVGLLDGRGRGDPFVLNGYFTALAFSSDSKLFATGWGSRQHYGGQFMMANPTKGIHVWEAASRQEVFRIEVPSNEATVVAFSPDGRRIVAGTVLGALKFHSLAPPGWIAPKKGDATATEKSWASLAGNNSTAAYRAIWDLTAGGDDAVAFLSRRLEPAPSVQPDRLRQLLKDLDSDAFETRRKAQTELARYGDAIEGDLERALQGEPSVEFQKSVQALLTPLRKPRQGADLRVDRAVIILERIGTPAAGKALEALGKGAAGARLTRDAQEARKRLTGAPPR